MKFFKCCIDFDSTWILSRRNDSVRPVENIVACIKKEFEIFNAKKSVRSCEFTFSTDDGAVMNELKAHLADIVEACYTDRITAEQFSVSLEEAEAPEKEKKTDEKKTESQSEIPGINKTKSDSKTEEKNSIHLINSLIGAEEFKALANECVSIAPHLKDSDTVDSFLQRKYLISVNDGYGLTEYLRLFGKLTKELGLYDTDSNTAVEEIVLESPGNSASSDIFSMALSYIRTKSKSRVICIDISEWMSKTSEKAFKNFLKCVEQDGSGKIIFFRVPFLEPDILTKIKNDLNDYLFVKSISVVPFDMKQLKDCAKKLISDKGFVISEDAMGMFEKKIVEEKSDGKFYGIKTVKKVISEILYQKQSYNAGHNVFDKEIIGSQIKDIVPQHTETGSSGIEMLDNMVGMKGVKNKINEIIAQIETAMNNENIQSPCIHMRFVGNPGTGKTTVARIVGQILREKGILRNGNFFEYGGREFCGRYVGETAPKTAAMCRDAYGSVLFIDEAYSLYREDASGRDYGREAIDTLIAEMENHRNDLLVIMAGYPNEMEHLMTANPGLRSRMPYMLEFPNFDRDELADIFFKMAQKAFVIDDEMKAAVKDYFNSMPDEMINSKEFSNARFARNLFERTWGKAALRMQMSGVKDNVLKAEDFKAAAADKEFSFEIADKTIHIGFN